MKTQYIITFVIISFLFVLSGCGADKITKTLERAVSVLEKESGKWQGTLLQLEKDLKKDGASLLANEVNNLMLRGIAATSGEFRCNMDFIGDRIKFSLKNLISEHLGKPVKARTPSFCNTIPNSIDLNLSPERRNVLTYVGYDLDIKNPVKAYLLDSDGTKKDVTTHVNYPNHYMMTVTTSGEVDKSSTSGIPFLSTSKALLFTWNDTKLASVAIIPPAPPKECMQAKVHHDDRGWPSGRGYIDFDGDGCKDFCRLGGAKSDLSMYCSLAPRKGETQIEISQAMNPAGYEGFRWWVDVNQDGKYDFCRIEGNNPAYIMRCTLSNGKTFGKTFDFPGHIDRGYSGGDWRDVNQDRFPDYCRKVGPTIGASVVQCLLSNGKAFIGVQ